MVVPGSSKQLAGANIQGVIRIFDMEAAAQTQVVARTVSGKFHKIPVEMGQIVEGDWFWLMPM